MKKIALVIGLLALPISVFCQINKNNYHENCEISDFWEVTTYLYNNEYNKTNEVYQWQNYWYMSEDDTKEFIPDVLVIQFRFNTNTLYIDEYENFIKKVNYTFKSVIQYKYGDTDYSYHVKNPKLSNPIVLVEQNIPLGKITKNLDKDKTVDDIFVGIPLKKHLKDLDIYIGDTFAPQGDFYALNQIIITSYFINEKGEIKNTTEFTFPINGCYKDMEAFGNVRYLKD